MKSSAKPVRKARQLSVESFVDLVWVVPIRQRGQRDRSGRVLHRLKGLPAPGRRLVLLRGYVGEKAPDVFAL